MSFFKKIFGSKKKTLQPEDLYHTEITNEYVRVTHPKRADEMISWADLVQVLLVNTDEGPLLPDVWLLLVGKDGKGCSIPQGSKGWDDVYEIVSTFPGFDFENVIKSASCTDNETFEIWKK